MDQVGVGGTLSRADTTSSLPDQADTDCIVFRMGYLIRIQFNIFAYPDIASAHQSSTNNCMHLRRGAQGFPIYTHGLRSGMRMGCAGGIPYMRMGCACVAQGQSHIYARAAT
jgi:hypothetical protein